MPEVIGSSSRISGFGVILPVRAPALPWGLDRSGCTLADEVTGCALPMNAAPYLADSPVIWRSARFAKTPRTTHTKIVEMIAATNDQVAETFLN